MIADNSNSNENRRISWSSLHGEIDFPLVDIIDDGYTALPTNATISGPIEFLMGYPSNLEATTPTYRMAFSRLETWLENVLDLGTNQINDDAITNAKIANGAVDTDQLATDAVTTAKMASGTAQRVIVYNAGGNPVVGQVDTNGLAADAVTSAKLADGAVGTTQINDDAVTSAKIANNAVGVAQLAHGTADRALTFGSNGVPTASQITTGMLGTSVVTNAKIDTMAATKLTGTIDEARLASGGDDGDVLTRTATGQAWEEPAGGSSYSAPNHMVKIQVLETL